VAGVDIRSNLSRGVLLRTVLFQGESNGDFRFQDSADSFSERASYTTCGMRENAAIDSDSAVDAICFSPAKCSADSTGRQTDLSASNPSLTTMKADHGMNTAENHFAAGSWHDRVLNHCGQVRSQLSSVMVRLKRQSPAFRHDSARPRMSGKTVNPTRSRTSLRSNWP
jgi:hypothetical protein